MEPMKEDAGVGVEEAMRWLPAHLLNEAFDKLRLPHQQQHLRHHHRHRLHHRQAVPRDSTKYDSTMHRKPRYPVNHASGGPGMQAIFLDFGQRSCGTGVFLPRRAGNNFQPSKKPACSPVLLPFRVVQALNLDVHALDSKLTFQRESGVNQRAGTNLDSVSNKKNCSNDNNMIDSAPAATQCCVASHQHKSSSPEIFLPKEWSY